MAALNVSRMGLPAFLKWMKANCPSVTDGSFEMEFSVHAADFSLIEANLKQIRDLFYTLGVKGKVKYLSYDTCNGLGEALFSTDPRVKDKEIRQALAR